MGTTAIKIVSCDMKQLLELLNKALADEWLAYYQYWIGAKVARGLLREAAAAEFTEHANEELDHAEKLVNRIIQLGGTPILTPEDWYKKTNCGYDAPENTDVIAIIKQNIKAEQCAIRVYQKLIEFVKDKDIITYNIVLEILEDEVEHEDDLETLLADVE